MSELKYFGCVLNESGTNVTEFFRKVMSGRKYAGAIRSLVNATGLQLQYKDMAGVIAHACSYVWQ